MNRVIFYLELLGDIVRVRLKNSLFPLAGRQLGIIFLQPAGQDLRLNNNTFAHNINTKIIKMKLEERLNKPLFANER